MTHLQALPNLSGTRGRAAALVVVFWGLCTLMQTMGLLHGFAHPKRGPVPQVQAGTASGERQLAGDWRARFGGHSGDSPDCQLFDLLTHADSLMPDIGSARLPPCAPLYRVVHAGWFHARQAAGYLARGPPQRA